jgi:hypothetical protein
MRWTTDSTSRSALWRAGDNGDNVDAMANAILADASDVLGLVDGDGLRGSHGVLHYLAMRRPPGGRRATASSLPGSSRA